MTRLLARQSRESLVRIEGVPRRRQDALPLAALVLRRLIKALQPREVIFSALGLREGLHFADLTDAKRREDPLLAACSDMAARESRFVEHGHELANFVAPLFADEPPEAARLRQAAALLSDVAWRVNPDYRGEQAFRRVLRAPFVGIDHPSRALVALSVYARYTGQIDGDVALPGRMLVREQNLKQALLLGQGLRLAHTFSGGTPGLVGALRLKSGNGRLVLEVPRLQAPLVGEVVGRRLDELAKTASLNSEVKIID